MVDVPGGDHTITCTRLALLDGRHIFLRTKWFNSSFSITAMDFPRSWSCHVAKQEVEYKASMLDISCEEFFSHAHLYLGDGFPNSQYSFEALRQRPNTMRLSWTIVDMSYTKEPGVTLFLQEDNSTMELVPEFLNVLMDTTLIVKDLLARRKISKSKKVRQLAMRFSASKVMKTSLSQQAPTTVTVGMRGGLDMKSEFPNSTVSKFNSSPVSHEPASRLTAPVHPSSLTTLDGRVQQRKLRTPAVDRVGSSQLQLPAVKVDGRPPPPKHSPEFTAMLYEDGLSSWAQPRTPIQTPSMSRPAPTAHGVEVARQNVHHTLAGDKAAILSHESRKLGGSGWINPRKSSTGVESRNFVELSGSKRPGASQGREGVITLSDSEEEDHHNLEFDRGILDDEDWLDPRIPDHLNDLMPDPWQGNIQVRNMNVSVEKGERCRSRLEFEAQTSLGCRSMSQKRKDRDDAHEDRTEIFDEGKRMQSKEQVSTPEKSLSRDKNKVDSAQVFVRAGVAPCIKAESEYQSEQNAVWQSGHPSTSNDRSSEKFASSFNNENRVVRAHWNTWISEAKTEVTPWETQARIGNYSMTGRSDPHVGNQQATENVVTTSSPCADSDRLVASLSLMKLDRPLDLPHTDNSEHLQSPGETPNVSLLPSEENRNCCRECPEIIISDRPAPGGAENPERICHTTELGKSKEKAGVSSDVSELHEKVKVESLEFMEPGENGGDRDSGVEPGVEHGLHCDTEGMTSAGELLKFEQREKSAATRPLPVDGRKVPGRKGRPPGTKAQLHLNSTKSVTQGTNTYIDRTTQSDKDDPRNSNLQRVSDTSRPVRRSKHSNSRGHPSAGVDREQQKVVPDSDCYNFDDDRVKEKIKPNEVWALYHDMDTMPRYLIRVKEVSMSGTFWVKASWLQPHIASEKKERQKNTLYPRGCGDFEELKETTIFDVINCFSHRMEFTTKLDKVIQVYPRKDEVWALYSKNDSNPSFGKAKQGKRNEQIGSFRIMVILSNCEEGRPLDVWVLRKRIGYRTLWVPGNEKGSLPIGSMERFSHRIPAYKLTLKDYPDLNTADIWDIDAAAVPECLGKVTW